MNEDEEREMWMERGRMEERARMRVIMDSIDTCPCEVCVEREPANINRLWPRPRPTNPDDGYLHTVLHGVKVKVLLDD